MSQALVKPIVKNYLSTVNVFTFVGYLTLYIPFYVEFNEDKTKFHFKTSPIQQVLCYGQHIIFGIKALSDLIMVYTSVSTGALFADPSLNSLLKATYDVVVPLFNLWVTKMCLVNIVGTIYEMVIVCVALLQKLEKKEEDKQEEPK